MGNHKRHKIIRTRSCPQGFSASFQHLILPISPQNKGAPHFPANRPLAGDTPALPLNEDLPIQKPLLNSDDLPDEVWLQIFEYAVARELNAILPNTKDLKTLVWLARTSHRFMDLANALYEQYRSQLSRLPEPREISSPTDTYLLYARKLPTPLPPFLLGTALARSRDIAVAIAAFDKAIDKTLPTETLQQRVASARFHMRKLLEKDPYDKKVKEPWAGLYMAHLYLSDTLSENFDKSCAKTDILGVKEGYNRGINYLRRAIHPVKSALAVQGFLGEAIQKQEHKRRQRNRRKGKNTLHKEIPLPLCHKLHHQLDSTLTLFLKKAAQLSRFINGRYKDFWSSPGSKENPCLTRYGETLDSLISALIPTWQTSLKTPKVEHLLKTQEADIIPCNNPKNKNQRMAYFCSLHKYQIGGIDEKIRAKYPHSADELLKLRQTYLDSVEEYEDTAAELTEMIYYASNVKETCFPLSKAATFSLVRKNRPL